jgi:hypothetical protein
VWLNDVSGGKNSALLYRVPSLSVVSGMGADRKHIYTIGVDRDLHCLLTCDVMYFGCWGLLKCRYARMLKRRC